MSCFTSLRPLGSRVVVRPSTRVLKFSCTAAAPSWCIVRLYVYSLSGPFAHESCTAAAGSWTSAYCLAFMGIDGGADPRTSLSCCSGSVVHLSSMSQSSAATGGSSMTARSCGARMLRSAPATRHSRTTVTESRMWSITPMLTRTADGMAARSALSLTAGTPTAHPRSPALLVSTRRSRSRRKEYALCMVSNGCSYLLDQ